MKNTDVKAYVYEWLANFYGTENWKIKELLDCQMATTYLLIWPVMEQNIFSGFMKQKDIKESARKYARYYSELNIEEDTSYFHKRYQDKTLYRKLKHGKYATDTDKIIDKEYEKLTIEEKLILMFFVVYRYRNNIFHGSKGINSWLQYSEQIEKCISFMIKIVDCHQKHSRL